MTNELSDVEVESARQELRDLLKSRPDLSMAHLGPLTKLGEGTIRSFSSGLIRGGREVVSEVRRVIAQVKAGDVLVPGNGSAVVLAEDPDARVRRVKRVRKFYETQTARRIGEVLDFCAENAAIGVVTADFGAGKTEAVREWRKGRGREQECLVVEFDEFTAANKVEFIRQLAEMLRLDTEKGSWAGAGIFRRVCAALRDRPRLLIFDQCELARIRVFQIIRQIWDRTSEAGVGVVLLAAPILATRMLGSRMADLGALTSRVGIWAMLSGITRHEMAAIVKQEGITEIDEAAFDLWWKATGGSMRRLMRAIDLLKSKHTGRRITEKTIEGLAGHLWGMNVMKEDSVG
jgi:DNA transposition AAA+ family ATPase